MTIPQNKKEDFLILRSEGKPYHQIAADLSVSKRTLIEWGKELKPQIDTLRSLRLEVLQEKYFVLKEKRLELFGEQLHKIINTLSKRNLYNVPTGKLFELLIKYAAALKKEEQQIDIKEAPDTLPEPQPTQPQ